MIVPMFDDSVRIWSTVIGSGLCTWESWSLSPCLVRTISQGTVNDVTGVTVPSLRAPDIVITLPTEPGS